MVNFLPFIRKGWNGVRHLKASLTFLTPLVLNVEIVHSKKKMLKRRNDVL